MTRLKGKTLEERVEVYKQEALKKGYELIEMMDGGYAKYVRLDCGHEMTKDIGSMRHNKQTWCPACSEEEHISNIEARGLELVEKILGAKPNHYRFKSCGHSLYSNPANLMKASGPIRCMTCYEDNEKIILESMGIEMLSFRADGIDGKSRPKKHGLYRFKDCGHEFSYIRHALKHGKQDCTECTNIKALKAIADNGYYLVGELAPVKITIGFDTCEHTREVFRSAAVRGNCVCQECRVSAYTRPSKIYALEIGNDTFSFIKFGYGKSVKARVREYGLQGVWLKNILFEIDMPTGSEALAVEKAVHREMADSLLDKQEMKKYFKHTGFSECYPLGSDKQLLLAVNKYEREQNEKT